MPEEENKVEGENVEAEVGAETGGDAPIVEEEAIPEGEEVPGNGASEEGVV